MNDWLVREWDITVSAMSWSARYSNSLSAVSFAAGSESAAFSASTTVQRSSPNLGAEFRDITGERRCYSGMTLLKP
jgi:hypothetical protein